LSEPGSLFQVLVLDPWLLIEFLFVVMRGLGEVYLYDPFNCASATAMPTRCEVILSLAL